MNERISGRIGAHLRSNIVGYVALFAALTLAPAFAATKKAPKNSVVSKSIKDGQVAAADLGNDAVTTEKIAAGAVTGTRLADNSVSVAKLGFNPVTDSQLDAFGSSLSAPGVVNTPGNPVDWTALNGVPAGFADGNDANSGGTVTSVGAGSGLSGGPVTGAGTLSLAACPGGQILKSTGAAYACATDLFARGTTHTTGATPDVSSGTTLVRLAFGSGTAVVNLTGGVDGQRVTLYATNGNASVGDGGSFALAGGWNPNADDTLTVVNSNGAWVEVARSAN